MRDACARYCGGNRRRGKWKSRGVRFVTRRASTDVVALPVDATCAKVGRRGGRIEARGVSCNCCTTHAAISSVCWRASLLYYITKSAAFHSFMCKSTARARRCRPTLRNRRARLSTVAELRQLDKTAASEASGLMRINPNGIVAFTSVKTSDPCI